MSVAKYKFSKNKKFHTSAPLQYKSEKEYDKKLESIQKDLSDFQEKLYAHDKYSVLIIFQARDAAGKDSTIKHIFRGLNPIGLNVRSFKRPSDVELDHDYLWRTTKELPPRGEITLFNRSYYEEVLVTKVHPQIIKKYQKIPKDLKKNFQDLFTNRYKDINNFEKFLNNNGTKVFKFFLNVSKAEQKERFLRRINVKEKNWKFSMQDLTERERWNSYTLAYNKCFEKTHTTANPWFIIPADDKRNMRLIIGKILANELKKIPVCFPSLNKEEKDELIKAKQILTQK